MKPTVIEVIGTIRGLVLWVVKEVLLLLLGIILFGLSAPLLFTVGIEILVWQGADMTMWAPIYFLVGPFACCIWMVFICHWHSMRQWQRAGKLNSWREDHGGIFRTVGRSIWFLISGWIGSAIAEAVFLLGISTIHHAGSQAELMLTFAIAPFFVFAPVLMVLLSRRIRRGRYGTV